jgi:TonB family protein
MRRFARASILPPAAWLAGLAPAVAGQAPAPSGSWNVDWGDHRCSLIRQDQASPPNYLALQVIPGSHNPSLRFVSRAWPEGALSDLDRISLSFEPEGRVAEGLKRREDTEAGPALVLFDAAIDLRSALAAARSVRVARDGTPLFEIATPSSDRALAALRECETTVMRQWGIDPVAHAAVRVPPRGNAARFVSNDDYPAASLRRASQGTVTFRLDLDRDGRATACRVLVGSGDQALDAATCRIMRSRARFEPARDAQGNAIPTVYVSNITWRIMGRSP